MTPSTIEEIPSDEALASRGDLVILHQRYGRRLFVYLSSLRAAREDLEDLAQEVWARVCKHLSSGQGFTGHFRGWLFSVARNLVIDFARRKKKPLGLQDDPALPDRDLGPVERLTSREEVQQLRKCIDRLPPRVAGVLQLHLGGEKPVGIAEKENVPIDRVYRLLSQARQVLSDCVQRGMR